MEYRLLTEWRIKAPLDDVYAVVLDSPHWPDWWPGVQDVELLAAGDADGVNSISRYTWQGQLPYRLAFDVRATRIEKAAVIEGTATGDLEGVGRWNFSRWGPVTVVRCEWHVRSTVWWMNLIAPVARAMFVRNHGRIMALGGQALASRLKATLVGQETIDLLARDVSPLAGQGWW